MQEEKPQCSDCGQRFERTQLCFIEDTTVFVSGLEAIDGSPVLDIKMAKNDWYY